jgi:subtilisin family serine protease
MNKKAKHSNVKLYFIIIVVLLILVSVGFVASKVIVRPITEIEISNKIDTDLKNSLYSANTQTFLTKEKTVRAIIKTTNNKQVISNSNISANKTFDNINVIVSDITAKQAINLSKDSNVVHMYADKKMKVQADMSTNMQYQSITPASSSNGKGINVCILDTGIYSQHSWFSGKNIKQATFVDGEFIDGIATDTIGHGTHVAGIITSVAPSANLFVGKVCGTEECFESDIMNGIQWCSDNNADVVSMSLGAIRYEGNCEDDPVVQQVNAETEQNNILFTMAAGNLDCLFCSDYRIASPACAKDGIAVSAVDVLWKRYRGNGVIEYVVLSPANYDLTNSVTSCDKKTGVCSKYDPGISLLDITANGDVESAWLDGGTAELQGTSMATPNVAGALASLMSIYPNVNHETIRSALYNGATKGFVGNGLLNGAKSCQILANEQTKECNSYKVVYDNSGNIKNYRFNIEGTDKKYKKYGTESNLKSKNKTRAFEPALDYYSQTKFKTYEVRKITNNVYITKRLQGTKTLYEIHFFTIDAKKNTATVLKLTEDTSTTTLRTQTYDVLTPFADCNINQTQQSQCKSYFSDASVYSNTYMTIKLNDLEAVKLSN